MFPWSPFCVCRCSFLILWCSSNNGPTYSQRTPNPIQALLKGSRFFLRAGKKVQPALACRFFQCPLFRSLQSQPQEGTDKSAAPSCGFGLKTEKAHPRRGLLSLLITMYGIGPPRPNVWEGQSRHVRCRHCKDKENKRRSWLGEGITIGDTTHPPPTHPATPPPPPTPPTHPPPGPPPTLTPHPPTPPPPTSRVKTSWQVQALQVPAGFIPHDAFGRPDTKAGGPGTRGPAARVGRVFGGLNGWFPAFPPQMSPHVFVFPVVFPVAYMSFQISARKLTLGQEAE